MALTALEIIALIFVLLGIVKLLCLLVKPRAWFKFAKAVYSYKYITTIGIILVIVTGYFLFQELTMVQIFATFAFLGAIMILGIAPFAKDIIGLADKVLRRKVMQKAWLSTIIWLILMLWVLWEIFAV